MARDVGILMSHPMILAGLAKVKTQTRRAIKPQPDCGLPLFHPRCEVGDHLYWKETHYKYGYWVPEVIIKQRWIFRPNFDFGVWFPDNLPSHLKLEGAIKKGHGQSYGDLGWYKRPSLFMFKKDARIWSTVLKVEAQQLKDMTVEDALAEGILRKGDSFQIPGFDVDHNNPLLAYRTLFTKINGVWNPELWVWKYTMITEESRNDTQKSAR